MRLSIILKFARVLMISRLRSTTRSSLLRGMASRPVFIFLIGAVLFAVLFLAGLTTVAFLRASGLPGSQVDQLVVSIFTGTPQFLTGFYFTMGLLWELNTSAEAESMDTINWLPITAGEYVVASTLSTSYTYSPVLMMAFGYVLPIAASTGRTLQFLLFLPIGFIASLTGSVAVEILRSGLSQASRAFGRIGGRLAILTRLTAVMLILVFTQILFSGFFVARAIGTVVTGVPYSNLVPVFWPSLVMARALEEDVVGATIFLSLGLAFLFGMAWIALFMRARFWVVSPVSVHFTTTGYASGPSRLSRLGLGLLSAALLRREFRSATRRKEVIRLIAIPIIVPVMIGLPLIFSPAPPQTGTASARVVSLVLGGPFLFGVGLGALFLGMTAIGQEGMTIWNLSALPLTARTLVKTKILFTSMISTVGLALGAIVTSLLFSLSLFTISLFVVVGLGVIVAEAGLGVAVGSRFPDFSEGPRPRFVTIPGSIVGSVVGIVGMLAMVSPVFVALLVRAFYNVRWLFPIALSCSVLLGLVIGWIGYALSIRRVGDLLAELPV